MSYWISTNFWYLKLLDDSGSWEAVKIKQNTKGDEKQKMDCIYLQGEECKVRPTYVSENYKPDAELIKNVCKNQEQMSHCARFNMYIAHLRAQNGK